MHEAWLLRSWDELDRAFGEARAPEIPTGEWRGTLIVSIPGLRRLIATAIRALVWHGKVFTGPGAVLNKVTPFSLRSVPGEVYEDASRMDGRPVVAIDYSRTSLIAKHVRDELREVAPGVLLGRVWWRGMAVCHFVISREDG